MPLRLIGVAGIVVVVAWGVIAVTTAIGPPAQDMLDTVAFACGYRVHQDRAQHYDDLPIDDWCLKIKATAAAHGFNP